MRKLIGKVIQGKRIMSAKVMGKDAEVFERKDGNWDWRIKEAKTFGYFIDRICLAVKKYPKAKSIQEALKKLNEEEFYDGEIGELYQVKYAHRSDEKWFEYIFWETYYFFVGLLRKIKNGIRPVHKRP